MRISAIIFSLIFIWSCKKDPKPKDSQVVDSGFAVTNSVDVNITNMAGSVPLALNTQTYVNANLDTFNVTTFKYYISNIQLVREDGFIFKETESYHLILQNDTTSCKFSIPNIPLGNYKSIEFTIGVDSLRNCSGAQSGALDPVNDMFWDWSQGYIFAKMEGQCNNASSGKFFHHIGGFTGTWNAIVKTTPSFGTKMIQVVSDKVPKLYMKADIMKWFNGPTIIDIATYSSVASGKKGSEISANYKNMFSVAAIKN